MKKFLLTVLAMVCVSIGAWAGTLSGTAISGTYNNGVQQIRTTQPGALAAWVEAHKNDAQQALGTEAGITSLEIIGDLNAADFAALNAAEYGAFSRFPKVDLSQATLSEGTTASDACSVNFGPGSFTNNGSSVSGTGATFIRMPNSMTNEASVAAMKTMQQNGKNSSVKVVGAYKPMTGNYSTSTYTLSEFASCSFAVNELGNFRDNMLTSTERDNTKVVRMAGEYGDQDLFKGNLLFNSNTNGAPAIWDFTGAHFANCTVNVSGVDNYYNYDDPFQKFGQHSINGNYTTNAFYYFSTQSTYVNSVVSIKLPDDQMTILPPSCLTSLGAENAANYKLVNHLTDAEFSAQFPGQNPGQAAKYAPIEELIIPECYTELDYECGKWAHIKHLIIGGNVNRIHGGAFLKCDELEDLDFGAGLHDCYVGDQAFNECESMKHIALSEGVVSVGASAFRLSKHMESIRLPQSLINIGNGAFDNCLSLNSIIIPRNVEQIGQRAFKYCPLTDIYLTTTDPERIPSIWTVGTSFGKKDDNSTFYSPDFDGNNGIPNNSGDHPAMTWEEAADYYYIHANGIPVLHYPEQLAGKVRASISDTYLGVTTDGVRIPYQGDRSKRENFAGAELGSYGQGTSSQDGWAQLMLMKGYEVEGPNPNVYTKEYDDVWYTMCFPFDLTDEQLAAAFNETFNIVDFSAVELDSDKKTLTLHFNNVAVTDYKDVDENHYTRKTDANGAVVREKDGDFNYNVYLDNQGNEYHHVITTALLSKAKTKTFAKGSSLENAKQNYDANKQAVIIDGILATAGHPYMIHPAIGINDGGTTKRKCDFAGITWKPQTQWPQYFENNSRTIDLGIAKNDSNYNQSAYTAYGGQKYYFIGNPKQYADGAEQAIGNEPDVPEKPVEPVRPPKPSVTLTEPTTPRMTEKPEAPTEAENSLFNILNSFWNNETSITASFEDYNSAQWNAYNQWRYLLKENSTDYFSNMYGSGNNADPYGVNAENIFNECKRVFNKCKNYTTAIAAYEASNKEWDDYEANQQAWYIYTNWNQETENEKYTQLLNAYNQAAAAHTTWENNAKSWRVQIPKNAYFLGRRPGAYPKYYRQKAEEIYGGERTTGLWPQFTAIIKVNQAAVDGIEAKLDSNAALSKGFDMAFNTDFDGEILEIDDEGIATIIEEASQDGEPQVEYYDIVVNINGQVVRRGTTSFEGLPKGLYIVNGKKYFVK